MRENVTVNKYAVKLILQPLLQTEVFIIKFYPFRHYYGFHVRIWKYVRPWNIAKMKYFKSSLPWYWYYKAMDISIRRRACFICLQLTLGSERHQQHVLISCVFLVKCPCTWQENCKGFSFLFFPFTILRNIKSQGTVS